MEEWENRMRNAIVLAAGKGTRMHSDLPKVLHKVCGMSMVSLVMNTLKSANVDRVVTITGHAHELVEKELEGMCEFALQEPQLGTGHAVMQAKQLENESGVTLVVYGDAPCISKEMIEELYETCENADMVLLTVRYNGPSSFGRIIRNQNNEVERIVEFKDCNEEEKSITELNSGFYAFKNESLFEALKELKNDNAQKEYYLTDVLEILKNKGKVIQAVVTEDYDLVQGVNDCVELAHANETMRKRINTKWMKEGVTMYDPETTYLSPEVTLGKDVILYPNVHLYGKTTIGDFTTILSGSYLENVVVGNHSVINASDIRNSEVKDNSMIGPWEHIEDNNRKD